jgi:hypothetical protein
MIKKYIFGYDAFDIVLDLTLDNYPFCSNKYNLLLNFLLIVCKHLIRKELKVINKVVKSGKKW